MDCAVAALTDSKAATTLIAIVLNGDMAVLPVMAMRILQHGGGYGASHTPTAPQSRIR
jgi:hypothetical protein